MGRRFEKLQASIALNDDVLKVSHLSVQLLNALHVVCPDLEQAGSGGDLGFKVRHFGS